LANQSSVRCEQLFNTGPLNLDGDVRHGKSAVLAYSPGLLNRITVSIKGSRPAEALAQKLRRVHSRSADHETHQ
jgi:hypothetical protein